MASTTRPPPAAVAVHPPPKGRRRRARQPAAEAGPKDARGPLLGTLLGGLLGAMLGLAAQGMVRAGRHGTPLWDEVVHALTVGNAAGSAWAIGGFLLGFLVTGLALRNRSTLLAFRLLGQALRVVLAAAAGLGFGALAYLDFHAAAGQAGHPGQALLDAFALGAFSNLASAFLLAGLLSGAFVGFLWAGRGSVRQAARLAAGATVGGIGGLVIYAVGHVLVRGPSLGPADFAFRMADAVFAFTPAEFLFVGVAAGCGALLSRYQWQLYGILTFVSLVFVVIGYLAYSATVTLPQVEPSRRWFSYVLFAAETLTLLMVVLYSFYTIDVASRKRWRRGPSDVLFSAYYLPKVAFHVPCFNEPPELVQDTLRSLLAVDYPQDRFVVMVCDDSTRPESQQPIEAFCRANGIPYMHRQDRRGFKAGALNDLLKATPEDVNLIAVIDADYQVEPEYLRETAGFFVDDRLGWVQTPQDYRNRHESFLTEQYYLADAYFYRTILPSRNEENSIIFCGTMGILRRRALEQVGGWGEHHITEDAELSVRLLNKGWRSLYVNKTYGRGLIPSTFEGYRKQHYRWAFGGGRILRSHALRLLFGRFTFRQRLDYLVGTLNWFEGALIFAIAATLLLLGLGELLGFPLVTHHRHEVLLVGLVPVFLLVDGITRVHLVLRRTIRLGFGGTLGILGMWFSVKFSNMRAAFKALLGFRLPFVRTSRKAGTGMGRAQALANAVRLTKLESVMSLLLYVTSAALLVQVAATDPDARLRMGRLLLASWLAFYGTAFLAAPLYAYRSSATPRRRHRTVRS
ncbi:MAG TPA: glycosyltransferase, partial [Candidatus Thermoplasmatota archaeon]|nr:glycosyltransferase [Candidatus Thermoplasmatota archaeon]